MTHGARRALRDRMIRQGWLGGHRDYTPFLLLARSRTGSNLVRGLLGSRSDVRLFGEVFKRADSIEWGADALPVRGRALALYRHDPVKFLWTYVLGNQPREIRAVGFKLFYYHAQTDPVQAIWPALKAMPGLRILHLTRGNVLRTHLSRALAERSGRWVSTSAERQPTDPIVLDYQACLKNFVQTRAWEESAREFFRGQAMLEILYEDLAADPSRIMAEVQRFLGLDVRDLQPETCPQAGQPLRAAIANFAELEASFRGTPWAVFFEDEPRQAAKAVR